MHRVAPIKEQPASEKYKNGPGYPVLDLLGNNTNTVGYSARWTMTVPTIIIGFIGAPDFSACIFPASGN